ncbi:MAG: RNA-binding S4 domain-containing protein [Ruminococcaceae bacterium]|jgi:ribosome-associated protein|nr:RNA-binding S4 domain-containing protein [Oscillospiraceae bacterium]
MSEKEIIIKEDFIRLDSLMKLSDAVVTGGHAKIVIQNGEVKVNGEVCTQRGKKMREGDFFTFDGLKVTVKKC